MAIFTDEQNEELIELQCAARNLAERIRNRRARYGRFQQVASTARFSRRGEAGRPWLTKKHTLSRLKSMMEAAAA